MDCLRLDFIRDPALNLPQYSIAIIGSSRQEVLARKEWILQRLGFYPFHEQWMSAPDQPEEPSSHDDAFVDDRERVEE